MINEHRYILEKGSKKHLCPECDKRRFVRYIDTETGEYLPNQYGRCDRESKCNYHLNPYLDGYAKAIWEQEHGRKSEFPNNWKPKRKATKPKSSPEPVFIPVDVLKKTLQPNRYEQNTFIQNLLHWVQYPFNAKEIEKVISLFYLGTVANGYRTGAITFPFIDLKGNVRTIQVKQFDELNHTSGTDFLHSIIEKSYAKKNKPLPEWLEAYIKQDKRVSCLFGEHLLSKYPLNPVALVEAPKTAVYGTLYFGFPEHSQNLIWLAVYNKSSFSFDKLKVLKGRDVFIFPDLSKEGKTFKEWQQKAKDFENRLPGTRFVFSDILEKLAPETDKSDGNDLADYLIKLDWRLFRKRKVQEQPTPEKKPEPVHIEDESCEKSETLKKTYFSVRESLPEVDVLNNENEQTENWDTDILELQAYFNEIETPKQPIKFNAFITITDTPKFIHSHLDIVKAQNGKRTFLPYLIRLHDLKRILLINLK